MTRLPRIALLPPHASLPRVALLPRIALLLFALSVLGARDSAHAAPRAANSIRTTPRIAGDARKPPRVVSIAQATPRALVPAQATPRVFINAQAPPRIAVVVLLPPADLDDWVSAPAPNLHRLLDNGACALMNTRAARVPGDHSRESAASAALTLGAGARAACGVQDGVFTPAIRIVSPGVTAQALFERRTARQAGAGDLVALRWPRLLRANRGVGYRVAPGSFAEALRGAGVRVYATDGVSAPLVASDAQGVAAMFSANEFLSAAPMTDSAAFIDAPADWRDADTLIGKAIQYTTQYGARLVVLSPSVSDREYAAEERLAPIVIHGPDLPAGLLTSPSTRTPGLIANTDVAGFIAGYFGAALPNARRPADFAARPALRPLAALESMDRQAMEQRHGMRLLPYFAVGAGAIVIFLLLVTRRRDSAPTDIVLLPSVAMTAFAVSTSTTAFLIAVMTLLLATLFVRRRLTALHSLRALCALIWLAAVIHMFAPHGVLKYSLLGYSVIEGARYYGIGNEMMGALAGAMLVTASGAESVWARRVMLVLVLATVGMAASPQIGAKAGGAIVSVGTLLVYFGSLRGVRWNLGRLALVAAIALAAMLAAAVLDSHLNVGRQSHLGQAVTGLMRSGAGDWVDIVTRKLTVEGRLLWRSAWAVPLWSALAGILFLRRTVDAMNSIKMRAIYRTGLAAILLSIAFNDAGAVAGAMCAMLLWTYLILVTKIRAADQESAARP